MSGKKLNEILSEMGWHLTQCQIALDEYRHNIEQGAPPRLEPESMAQNQNMEISISPRGVRFFINEYPPRIKMYTTPAYVKDAGYRKIRDRWYSLVVNSINQVAQNGHTPIPRFDRCAILFTFHFPDQRLRDPDRYAVKYILDALCWAGVLVDDNYQKLTIIMRGKVNQTRPGTEIAIANMYAEMEKYLQKQFTFSDTYLPNHKPDVNCQTIV